MPLDTEAVILIVLVPPATIVALIKLHVTSPLAFEQDQLDPVADT